MPSSTPFVDPETGVLDRDQIRREAGPLVRLIGLFVGLALVPLFIVFAFGGSSPVAFAFTLLAQFVLAVGAGITLMYVIARAIALSNDDTANARLSTPRRASRRDATRDERAVDAGDPPDSSDDSSGNGGSSTAASDSDDGGT